MMALTARTLDIAERTIAQLKSIHIQFDGHSLQDKDLKIPASELGSKDDALFTRGVLFVGETNNKGKVLAHFLDQLHYHPEKIVFVDDKRKHVDAVEAALAKVGVPYIGFRYGALDKKVKAYNELMSEVTDELSADLLLEGVVNPKALEKIEKTKAELAR
jgi:hypothetical protein